MNLTWQSIWKECVIDGSETIPVSTINQETLIIGCNGFPELEEDIDEMISSYEEELSNEDLLELNKNKNYDKVQEEESEKPDEEVITLKGLFKAFQLIEEGLQIINDIDSNHE